MTPEIITSIFTVIQNIIPIIFGISLFYQLIGIVYVFGSPHKDTGVLRLLNVIVSTGLFFNVDKVIDGVWLLVAQIIILIVNYCISEYLRRNKYYS